MEQRNFNKNDQVVLLNLKYKKAKNCNIEDFISSGIILSSGRKYLTVKHEKYNHELKFIINENYLQKVDFGSPDYQLFKTKEEAMKCVKEFQLYQELKEVFCSYTCPDFLSVEQLEEIRNIIHSNSNELQTLRKIKNKLLIEYYFNQLEDEIRKYIPTIDQKTKNLYNAKYYEGLEDAYFGVLSTMKYLKDGIDL